jgi:hypothetical protein
MNTSPIRFRHRAALALIVSTIMVPASSALAQGDTPADFPGMPGNPQTAQSNTPYVLPTRSGDTPADFPGMPGSPQPVASHASDDSGFDWISAAIGAGGAGVLIVVSLGGATAAARMRVRTVRS